MPQPRPLPRSLVPLAGESLPGFLLRLSYRLNQPPARIAELTGLSPGGRSGPGLPVILLAGIPASALPVFTRMTRLAKGQAAQLGLAAWRERYPPVIATPEGADDARRLSGQLVFAPATRYCPDCLAGDGSAVQKSFGGPWLRAWHLPTVFACPAHGRLLEHCCPECGQAVRARRPGRWASLLPAMLAAGLHPAQCRTEVAQGKGRHPACCGARLDQAGQLRPASPGLVSLQDKILGVLDPAGPASTPSAGQPAPPADYFADLHALGVLACSTWPAARHLIPTEDAASAIDQHVDSCLRQAAGRQASSPDVAARARFDFPPADAAASGGLAHIADHILTRSADEAREELSLLLPANARQAGRTPWARWVTRAALPCSAGLRAACDPLIRGFTKAAGEPQGRRNAVLAGQRWGPENVPALLPEDWYARHFTPLAGVNPLFTRRTAVLRLVQMVAGGSLGEAAAFLGIATTRTTWQGRIYSGAGFVHTAARQQQPDPRGFEDALTELARELDDPATSLINYWHRRQELQAWCIGEDAWTRLAGQLPPVRGTQPELGDRKRQIASVYVWVQVTSGEHYFAPRPISAAQPPEVQAAWQERHSTIWHLMHRSRPGQHYASLKAELDIVASSLAGSIDAHPRSQP